MCPTSPFRSQFKDHFLRELPLITLRKYNLFLISSYSILQHPPPPEYSCKFAFIGVIPSLAPLKVKGQAPHLVLLPHPILKAQKGPVTVVLNKYWLKG